MYSAQIIGSLRLKMGLFGRENARIFDEKEYFWRFWLILNSLLHMCDQKKKNEIKIYT